MQHAACQEEMAVAVGLVYKPVFLETALLRDVLTIFIYLHLEPITPASRKLFDQYFGKSVTIEGNSYILDAAFFGRDLPVFIFYKTEGLPRPMTTPLRVKDPLARLEDVLASVTEMNEKSVAPFLLEKDGRVG